MIQQKIDLYAYFGVARGSHAGGFLTTYIPQPHTEVVPRRRPAMLVLPGGAYVMCSAREDEPIALRFVAAGYAAFTLQYTTQTAHPVPLSEACMAIRYIRENADSLGVDGAHVAAVGFSAGGHLCATLASLYDAPEIRDILGAGKTSARPDAVVLSYPVVTLQNASTHSQTRDIVTGGDKKLYAYLSADTCVHAHSSPAFIWHTTEDAAVPVENSLLLAQAYRAAGVPFALHIFTHGWHGLSLATDEVGNGTDAERALEPVGKWVELALDWLTALGFRLDIRK